MFLISYLSNLPGLSQKTFGRVEKALMRIFSIKNHAYIEEPSEYSKMCLRNQLPLFSCLGGFKLSHIFSWDDRLTVFFDLSVCSSICPCVRPFVCVSFFSFIVLVSSCLRKGLKVVTESFKEVSGIFQGCFNFFSSKIEGCFK